jgi:hypothetical protein
VSGAIAAAGKENGVKYSTRVTREIRMDMASLMIRPIDSFNELSDDEIHAIGEACTYGVVGIAQWLAGRNYPCTEIEERQGYFDAYEEPAGCSDDYNDCW